MLTLFQFAPAFNVPNPSPYCLKVETYLRMAGLEYRVRSMADPRKAPRGKLPFIELDGQLIADSAIILRTLSERGSDLDAPLDAPGRARALAIARLCDEHLAVLTVYFRWIDDEGWAQIKPAFFGTLPAPLRWIVPGLIRRKLANGYVAQGIGRHSRNELLDFAREDLQALDALLGAAAFFGGAQPCSADASAYGVLANLILATAETPVNRMAREFPRLVAYCQRVREQFWA
ncbi:glutathione S-transferase family protein [Pseudomonas sp. N040]|uniref:glutathione S-transferase family protein n=1 Tax=Pseudomonas sp. N040 TaxID=2785325 RepID=UPI0018A32D76|nr:glutathione S-transferase family protein [Pseudomonas sp. N040]MBF7729795.1 glutathione S-transferase family protein [Pseudomonas sp. N040]MBW7013437.1 glutathione S-transferase family protein [Pseudomonas sp. N040]